MEPKELENLRKKEQHLNEWLRRYRKAKNVVPEVQENLDMTRWEIDALENRPSVASGIPISVDLSFLTAQDYKFTRSALPLMPDYNPAEIGTASSTTTSGATVIYNHIAQYADFQDAQAIEFSNRQTKRYREIQAEQERPKQVRNLMQLFCSAQTIQRYDIATQAYLRYKSDDITRVDAANSIRNALDGIKGDLFERARTTPKENMTWEAMSQRLARGVDESGMLIRNEAIRTSLIKNLSEVLKDREHGSITNLDNLWAQTLDFIYSVLNLLKH